MTTATVAVGTASASDVNTTPSHVTTITVVAQILGTLVTAYGGLLSAWSAQHQDSLWPPVVLSLSGLLLVLATHYGYVKGQVTSQNAIVAAVVTAASSPLVIQLLQGLLSKTPTSSSPPPGIVVSPAAAAASSALTAAGAPPSSPR